GCLMVGCCHGRPHRWGIRYREEHAAAGFPSYLVGVRLFPIQAVESLWVLGTVVVGTYFVWSGRQPGSALAWYIVTYDAGRFAFEFARGDAERPYWLGFSQAQWLSLVLTGGVVWAERAGVVPFSRWHLAVFALLAAAMIAVSLGRRLQEASTFQLLHPRHVHQVADAVKVACGPAARSAAEPDAALTVVSLARTSLGVQISGSEVECGAERVRHFTLSSAREPMTESTAGTLAELIRRLVGAVGPDELIAGPQGLFHLLIRVPEVTQS
ncbi:MAG: prolipoprotein diacylglyceryl transferase family protein, partial [Terracidiphilus sp.]